MRRLFLYAFWATVLPVMGQTYLDVNDPIEERVKDALNRTT